MHVQLHVIVVTAEAEDDVGAAEIPQTSGFGLSLVLRWGESESCLSALERAGRVFFFSFTHHNKHHQTCPTLSLLAHQRLFSQCLSCDFV